MVALRLLEEGAANGPDVAWLIWVVLVAFISMVFLGWWASKRLPAEQEPVQSHEEQGHEEPH